MTFREGVCVLCRRTPSGCCCSSGLVQAPSSPAGASVGVKADAGKLGTHLLPTRPLEAIARVLDFGASKYAPNNWRGGIAYSRVYGAVLRHLWAWWRGEDKDPETGHSHLAHAGCCLLFLLAFEKRAIGNDDRNKLESVNE